MTELDIEIKALEKANRRFPDLNRTNKINRLKDQRDKTNGTMNVSVGDKRKDIPKSVTIDCLELIEFVDRVNVVQSSQKMDGLYEFTFIGYNEEFIIRAHYETLREAAEYHHGDRGMETVSEGHYYDTVTIIESAFKVGDDGEVEIKLDDYTKNELLNHLNIEA